jgi:4-hydroxy-2-oxoheptanedioate aldolase
MQATINRVKQQLAAGAVPLGIVCRTLSPVVVELIGLAGFDFVWLDMEHTTADFGLIENLCRAADAVGIESLVRIPDQSSSNILRALESGAAIVNVPQISDGDAAEAVGRAAKFAPEGERGVSPSSRGMRYGFASPGTDPFAAANQRVMAMVQIESAEGVRSAAEICAVDSIDAVFVGLVDLSHSLGVPGETEHPRVLDAARQVLAAGSSASKPVMMLVDSAERGKGWVQEGARMLCCGVDVPTFGRLLQQRRDSFRFLQSRSAGDAGR